MIIGYPQISQSLSSCVAAYFGLNVLLLHINVIILG